MIRVAVHGAAGRMGKRLVDLLHQDSDIDLVAALEADGHPALGEDVGTVAGIGPIGLPLTTDLPLEVDVVIDFSTASAVDPILLECSKQGVALVIATTGFGSETERRIKSAAHQIPIVWAPNTSLAVNLTMRLAEVAAGAMKDAGRQVDVEIIETHHRFKADAPSGTALKFGEIISSEMGLDEPVHGRQGQTGTRGARQLGYHAVRAGDDAGRHTILFGMMGEKIELTVAATTRDCYASGAITAAKFLSNQPAGLYSMYDVLGLDA